MRILTTALVPLLASAVPEGYVLVPGGFAHRDCVHSVPAGAVAAPVNCNMPMIKAGNGHGAAWKAWAQIKSPTGGNVTSLNSTWVVPGEPQVRAGQTLFWWNGMEPADTSAVLQPVLQWGSSAAGGGDYWAVSSWFVSGSQGSHFSPLVRVASGDVISGTNTLLADGITWAISASTPGSKPSELTFKPAPGAWPTAYHVLEAYGVTTICDLYPAAGAVNFTVKSLAFDGVEMAPPIDWDFMTQTAGCGERASANADGSLVEISFKTSR